MKQILKINPKYFKEFKECIILSLAFSLNYYVGGTEKLNELIGVFAESFLNIKFDSEIPMIIDNTYREKVNSLRDDKMLDYENFRKMVEDYVSKYRINLGKKYIRVM